MFKKINTNSMDSRNIKWKKNKMHCYNKQIYIKYFHVYSLAEDIDLVEMSCFVF